MENRDRSRKLVLMIVMCTAIITWAVLCCAILISTMFMDLLPWPLHKILFLDSRNLTAMVISAILTWVLFGSAMLIWVMLENHYPPSLADFIGKYSEKLRNLLVPYTDITFDEFAGKWGAPRQSYKDIGDYLGHTAAARFSCPEGSLADNSSFFGWWIGDDDVEVVDVFQGVRVWWISGKQSNGGKRFYSVHFHKRHWDLISGPYLNYVLRKGRSLRAGNRWRRLCTNHDGVWDAVAFDHPATFDTLAMEAGKKKEIMEDLMAFSKNEDYYKGTGRVWKRGYLLYGPPGTGKSTMIAAIANFLSYDVYNLDLSEVGNNTELKKLLIDVSSKSIVVIEDIDSALNLIATEEKGSKTSKVTLSGLLDFVDGLWSAYRGENLIVFTTNHVEKLDQSLIRKGRMDKKIELSYCKFEEFKVLAWNYLNLDSHPLFTEISELLERVDMTPADVAEHLTAMAAVKDAGICLEGLISELREKKSASEGTKSSKKTNDDQPGKRLDDEWMQL